jgi:hypothetical protein
MDLAIGLPAIMGRAITGVRAVTPIIIIRTGTIGIGGTTTGTTIEPTAALRAAVMADSR